MTNGYIGYGDKGCTCFYEGDNSGTGRWMPNARCTLHGLLAGLVRDRNETGTYRVIRDEPEPMPNDCEACREYGECLDCQQEREEAEANDAPCRCATSAGPASCPRHAAPPRPMPEPGGEAPDVARAMLPPSAFGLDVPDAGPADCSWGTPYSCRVHCPPTTEEGDRGILAALRRWTRRLLRTASDLADD